MRLEIFVEYSLVREMKTIDDFLYRHIGISEELLGLQHHVCVYPFRCTFAGYFLDELGQILGTEAELIRIEGHSSLF